jgi:hypothetical protein
MKGRRLLALAALVLVFGCRDEKLPTAPEQRAAPTDPSEIISDGAHNGGNPDFFFLPPMVPLPLHNANFELGKFNNTLKGSLKIDICELNAEPGNGLPKAATGCARAVKTFAPGSVQVVNLPLRQFGWWNLFGLPPDGFYYALWDTRQSNLNVNKYYRIRVYIAGSPDVLLGIADVDPMANLFQWKYTLTSEVIQLIDDVQLPIVFRVEKGGGPALCGAGAVCNSVTVTNNNPAGFQTVTVDGGSGAVAGAKFPNGWLPAGGPQSVVVTISSVNTGANNPATGTQTIPCHANLPLQQFKGCFNFSTTPRLASNDSGDQFATPVTVAVCYVLQGTGDPREKFAEMWASGPNEPPHPLDDVSDAGILSPATRNCSNSIIGSNNSKGVTGFASSGWRTLKGGFGALFGVQTAYGVDFGLGGITKKFSNIGPALSARIDTVTPTLVTVPNGGMVTPFVRIVGSNHHDGEHQNSVGLGGLAVSFVASATTGLSAQGADAGIATQLTAITNTLPINVENPTSGGGFVAVNWNVPSTPGTYTLTATGPTINGPITFVATVPVPEAPQANFIGLAPNERRMLSMQTGAKIQLGVNDFPTGVSWFPGEQQNVTVSEGGLLTAVVGGESIEGGADATIESSLGIEQSGPSLVVNSFNFDIFPRHTTLVWNAVPGAVSYHVVSEFGNGAESPSCGGLPAQCSIWTEQVGGSTTTSGLLFTFDFVGEQPGRWRVFALNAAGGIIATSPYVYFNYNI